MTEFTGSASFVVILCIDVAYRRSLLLTIAKSSSRDSALSTESSLGESERPRGSTLGRDCFPLVELRRDCANYLNFFRTFSVSSENSQIHQGMSQRTGIVPFRKEVVSSTFNVRSYSPGPGPFLLSCDTNPLYNVTTISGLSEYLDMACNSPDYIPSEMSAQNSPLPSPGPATRFKRPAPPRNAVMHREHPPLYAGDFNNNLSKDMYWWEKLDVNDPEEKRVLLAMYYGEERRPRCTVCEKQNRACMWFLGEEEQTHKSCVKCRRVHATCKPSRSRNMEPDVDDSRPSIEAGAQNDQQRTSLRKRKASELTDDQTEVIFVRSQDNQHAGKHELMPQNLYETPLRSGPKWASSRPTLDDETQTDALADRSTTAEPRDGSLSSITLCADPSYGQEIDGQEGYVRKPRRHLQNNTMPGFSQIEKGLYAIIDERHKAELENLRTMIKKQAADHQAQMMALRADCMKKGQTGEAVEENQVERLETQMETERSNRRWLEDEITRLKARVSRLEGGQ